MKSLPVAPIFAAFVLSLTTLSAQEATPTPRPSTTDPQPRNPWIDQHEGYVKKAKAGNIDVVFFGDSITQGWNSAREIWAERFEPLKAANFGIGGDRTENVLWRIQNGELEGYKPKVAVVMIGTNNLSGQRNNPTEVAAGVTAIVEEIKKRTPDTKILLLGIFPRNEKPDSPARKDIAQVNEIIAKLDDGKTVTFMDIGKQFLQPDGTITKETMPDFLHLTPKGYQIWADAIKDKLAELLGGKSE